MMAIEANTFDLYLKLGRQFESVQAREVFFALADKEKNSARRPGIGIRAIYRGEDILTSFLPACQRSVVR